MKSVFVCFILASLVAWSIAEASGSESTAPPEDTPTISATIASPEATSTSSATTAPPEATPTSSATTAPPEATSTSSATTTPPKATNTPAINNLPGVGSGSEGGNNNDDSNGKSTNAAGNPVDQGDGASAHEKPNFVIVHESSGHSSAFYFLVLFFVSAVVLAVSYIAIQHRKKIRENVMPYINPKHSRRHKYTALKRSGV